MTMRVGRSRAEGNRAIRRILRQFDATDINVLVPAHYPAVIAAVTIPSAADFYGTVTDVRATGSLPGPSASFTPASVRPSPRTRARTALVAELEAQLKAAKAKTKRSVPSGRANYGAPAHFGDQADDAPQPEYPAGERVR